MERFCPQNNARQSSSRVPDITTDRVSEITNANVRMDDINNSGLDAPTFNNNLDDCNSDNDGPHADSVNEQQSSRSSCASSYLEVDGWSSMTSSEWEITEVAALSYPEASSPDSLEAPSDQLAGLSLHSGDDEKGWRDCVIMHTDEDSDDAEVFATDLKNTCAFTVDKFSNICFGETSFKAVSTLHDKYRCIMIFVTRALLSDDYTDYLNQIAVICGLKGTHEKKDRVIPVKVDIENEPFYLQVVHGITYDKNKANPLEYCKDGITRRIKELRRTLR